MCGWISRHVGYNAFVLCLCWRNFEVWRSFDWHWLPHNFTLEYSGDLSVFHSRFHWRRKLVSIIVVDHGAHALESELPCCVSPCLVSFCVAQLGLTMYHIFRCFLVPEIVAIPSILGSLGSEPLLLGRVTVHNLEPGCGHLPCCESRLCSGAPMLLPCCAVGLCLRC